MISAKPPPLSEGDVHVWRLELTKDDFSCSSIERQQASQWSDGRRQEFLRTRHTLRQLLSLYKPSIRPEEWTFVLDGLGKPRLSPQSLSFSLSHSGASVAIAIALTCEVGVDLELKRPVPEWSDLANDNFTPNEREYILSQAQPESAFLQVWTIKEAVSKAAGYGLSQPFWSLEVSLDSHGLWQVSGSGVTNLVWTITSSVEPDGAHLATATLSDRPVHVQLCKK